MTDTFDHDWRVTEGPSIGREPEFELSDIRFHSSFSVTGTMMRSASASLSTGSPATVHSLGRPLSELSGFIRIYDHLPEETFYHLFGGAYDSFELHSHRGVLAMVPLEAFTRVPPESFLLHLYLPDEQFSALLPMLAAARGKPRLYIEIERTLDQNVFEEDGHFWNDRVSPLFLFNEFRFDIPTYGGSVSPAPGSRQRIGA